MEHPDPEVFEKAARHVQLEPVWVEARTLPGLCAAAIIALVRIEGSRSLPRWSYAWLIPRKTCGSRRLWCCGAVGMRGRGWILRLKARIGDRDPDVLTECLLGLLTVDPKENLAIVTEFLEPGNAARCEAAALARAGLACPKHSIRSRHAGSGRTPTS